MVPGELTPFLDLLARLGVPDRFTPPQFVGLLAGLAADFGADPLPAHQLEQCVAVVQVTGCYNYCNQFGERMLLSIHSEELIALFVLSQVWKYEHSLSSVQMHLSCGSCLLVCWMPWLSEDWQGRIR